jgi:RNA polymerase sigma factor (sigma-70 family)
MEPLIDLVQALRDATTLEDRIRFAEEIVCRVGPSLLRFIDRHARPDFVEDAHEETLIVIANTADRCRARTDKLFWRWCYQVARHKIADQWRKSKASVTASLDLEEIRQAVEAVARQETLSEAELLVLENAMELVSATKPPCVDYLWEYAQGLSHREIAEIHGLKYDAARIKLARCLELARELAKKAKVMHV